jgi:hypothetical protein
MQVAQAAALTCRGGKGRVGGGQEVAVAPKAGGGGGSGRPARAAHAGAPARRPWPSTGNAVQDMHNSLGQAPVRAMSGSADERNRRSSFVKVACSASGTLPRQSLMALSNICGARRPGSVCPGSSRQPGAHLSRGLCADRRPARAGTALPTSWHCAWPNLAASGEACASNSAAKMYSPFEHTRYQVWSGAVAAHNATEGVTCIGGD